MVKTQLLFTLRRRKQLGYLAYILNNTAAKVLGFTGRQTLLHSR